MCREDLFDVEMGVGVKVFGEAFGAIDEEESQREHSDECCPDEGGCPCMEDCGSYVRHPKREQVREA